MGYTDNARKFTCILSASCPPPRLMNALAHAVAGLIAKLPADAGEFLDHRNEADQFTASISRFPFIILKAKSSSQLAAVRKAAAVADIPHNVFVSAMLGHSASDQVARTESASGTDLDYWVVALFGDADTINPLTRRFSLFSAFASNGG